ncbi:MAG: ATP-binding protein [Bacteroidales bacterium]|jgi:hypothetical protein|nr:ATP-binding protein [Bacteroidales bacterium]
MITGELKQRILDALQKSRENFSGSDAKFSVSIGINSAQYNRIKNGDTEKVLADAKWISLARRLGVDPLNMPAWNTVETPVFRFITTQLEVCQQRSLSAILCDLSDIGKSYVARQYCAGHPNASYIDCSQVKSRSRLIRSIAKSFGVGYTGLYSEVYGDLVFYLKTLPAPLVVLDEAGDISYEAFLEIKALWNATELSCGFYMMGADGLKDKISRGVDMHRVGFTEIFSRFGRRYGHVIPLVKDERDECLRKTAMMIIKANMDGLNADANRLLRISLGDDGIPSLRRIYKEIMKLRFEQMNA